MNFVSNVDEEFCYYMCMYMQNKPICIQNSNGCVINGYMYMACTCSLKTEWCREYVRLYMYFKFTSWSDQHVSIVYVGASELDIYVVLLMYARTTDCN